MYLKLSREEIFDSTNIYQLNAKKQYLLDTLSSKHLSRTDVIEINTLISLINYRIENLDDLVG